VPDAGNTDWHLLPQERQLVLSKRGALRLSFAVLLKFFQHEGRFPQDPQEVPAAGVVDPAEQLALDAGDWPGSAWDSRAFKYHRAEIRKLLGFREFTTADGEALGQWLQAEVLPETRAIESLRSRAVQHLREQRLEPPTPERLERIVRAARQGFDDRFSQQVFAALSPADREALEALLRPTSTPEDPDGPVDPAPLRMLLLTVFCHARRQALTDRLADLLVALVHRIGAKAEQRIERDLLEDLKRVAGKTGLLFRVAEASLAQPEGTVKEVIFPVVDEPTLRALVQESQASGPGYRHALYTRLRASYRGHYRRMLAPLLNTLTFRSNNERHRPVIDALALLKRYLDRTCRAYPVHETVPLEGLVPPHWRAAVQFQDARGRPRVHRLSCEICVLQRLRDQLRCREIWVEGADRYRNPDADLPADFETQRDQYDQQLGQPQDAAVFVQTLQQTLHEELTTLNQGMPTNPDVQILPKAGGWIKLSPLPAQPDPTNLLALKTEIGRRWPMTNLLDVLKETDLRLQLTEVFRSPTAFETLDRATLRHRLLLCLYGLGTNIGLKRLSLGQAGVSYKDLLYVQRRFITPEHLREAIARLVNQILAAR
jgi:Domain of unknown function (DUF4158)/Tn3 transposase DDE domain